jgi:ribosomal protein S18 acetylase RimI-like enzyme
MFWSVQLLGLSICTVNAHVLLRSPAFNLHSLTPTQQRHNALDLQLQPEVPGLTISEAQAPDVEEITRMTMVAFFGELGDDYGFNNNRATAFATLYGDQQKSIRKSLAEPGATSYKAVVDGSLVGFATCTCENVLTNMAVDASCRRRGIGRQLVERVLLDRGRTSVSLEVDADNDSARSLYEDCGFAVTEQKRSTRYAIDWWRGRVVEWTLRLVMRQL